MRNSSSKSLKSALRRTNTSHPHNPAVRPTCEGQERNIQCQIILTCTCATPNYSSRSPKSSAATSCSPSSWLEGDNPTREDVALLIDYELGRITAEEYDRQALAKALAHQVLTSQNVDQQGVEEGE